MSMLGNEIANLRKKFNLSQNAFAQEIGVTRQMVSLWERGIFLPDEAHFQAICKTFDLPDDYFLRQLSSPEVLEQETAIASAPAERKRRNRLLKGLLLCGLSLAMVILALVMTVSILVSIDLQMGHTAVNASTFGIPWIDRVILCAVLLIVIIAVMLFIILKPIIQKRKTQKNNKKSEKEYETT